MVPPKGNDFSLGARIGSLEAQVVTAVSAVANLTTRWERQDEAATQGRRVMHEKLDQTREEVGKLRNDVGQLTQETEEMGSRVGTIEQWKKVQTDQELVETGWNAATKAAGMRRLAIAGVLATAIGGVLVNWLLKDVLPRVANLLGL